LATSEAKILSHSPAESGAVWVKTKEETGTIRLFAEHPVLGTRMIEILVREAKENCGSFSKLSLLAGVPGDDRQWHVLTLV
jgi:hypothetical protein